MQAALCLIADFLSLLFILFRCVQSISKELGDLQVMLGTVIILGSSINSSSICSSSLYL